MRIVKSVFLIFIIFLLFIMVGGLIFLKTFDLNQYKALIVQQLATIVGREIGIEKLSLDFSFSQGLGVGVQGLRIKDLPSFSNDFLFTSKYIRLDFDIWAFIKERKVLVSMLQVKDPVFSLIRDEGGNFNIPSLQAQHSQAKPLKDFYFFLKQIPGLVGEVEAAGRNPSIDLTQLVVQSIHINNGEIMYIDKTGNPPLRIPLKQIDLYISDFSLRSPFSWKLRCALWSPRKNLDVRGKAVLSDDFSQIDFQQLNIKTNLSELSIGDLQESLSFISLIGFEAPFQGEIDISMDKLTLGLQGVGILSLDGRLSDGVVKIKHLLYPIENIDAYVNISQEKINVKELSMYLAGGKVDISAQVDTYRTHPVLFFKAQWENIRLQELMVTEKLPVLIEGKVFGHFEGQGEGFETGHLLSSFAGTGTTEVKEGRILSTNLLRVILDRISVLPSLVEEIEARLPQRYKEKLEQVDTVLHAVKILTEVREGKLIFPQIDVDAEGFILSAQGTLDPQLSLTFQSDLYIPGDLSESMIEAVGELDYLKDDQQRIRIPFHPYQGPLSEFRFYPDVEAIGKKIIKTKGKEELKKVIFEALDIESTPQDQQGPQEETAPASSEEKEQHPEEVLIDNILDAILK